MKRTPIVLTATVVGLVAVLEFHARPASGGSIPAAASSTPASGGTGSGAPPRPGESGGARTVTGPAVNYSWGVLSVSVTVSGSKITKVGIASLDDGGNPRSQVIDQQSIPLLEQEALQAQSANIQGVSGASYTSSGFQQSLQAALRQAGFR
jgi:hypothetical protein